MKQNNIALVYMVAGMSSRFKGKIKQFAKVTDNETLIEYSMNQAIKSGFTKIIFIVGNKTQLPFKEKFKNKYKGIPIEYALQTYDESARDRPWGTTDALCSAKEIIKEPFIVCNGDDIYGEKAFEILANHLKNNKNSNEEATLGYKLINVIPDIGKTHRGIFKINKEDYVESLTETFNIEKSNLSATNTKPDDLCSMNIFALHPETLKILDEKLKQFKRINQKDRKIEFLLPDEISNLIKENKIKMKIYPCNEKWFGITNPGDEEIIKEQLKQLWKNH